MKIIIEGIFEFDPDPENHRVNDYLDWIKRMPNYQITLFDSKDQIIPITKDLTEKIYLQKIEIDVDAFTFGCESGYFFDVLPLYFHFLDE